jgi:hypothetical protein
MSIVRSVGAGAEPWLVYRDLQCAVLVVLRGTKRLEREHVVRVQVRYASGDTANQVFVVFEDLTATLIRENR